MKAVETLMPGAAVTQIYSGYISEDLTGLEADQVGRDETESRMTQHSGMTHANESGGSRDTCRS